jgi:hypothetical protein
MGRLAGNRHSLHGIGIYDKPQSLFDAGFYFWYKEYISFDTLSLPPIYRNHFLPALKSCLISIGFII